VSVERHNKTKKVFFSNLEIFRIREKDVPVEVVEVKEQISSFAWEPEGRKFIIITSKDPSQKGAVNSVCFYAVEAKDNTKHISKSTVHINNAST
jgi:translation initiation factor 3 subunit B